MQVEVYERSDDTLMIFRDREAASSTPRSCGDLLHLGACTVDERALHPWVASRLLDPGYCAVVGDDAASVRIGLTGHARAPRYDGASQSQTLIGARAAAHA